MSDEVTQLRLVVTVPDFDAALAFYRDELGLPRGGGLQLGDGTRVSILAPVGPPSSWPTPGTRRSSTRSRSDAGWPARSGSRSRWPTRAR